MADYNKIYDDVCDVLHDQVKKIARKGDGITPQELDNMYKAIDVIKDISTIKAMEKAESEYSADYSADYSGRRYYPPRSYDHEQMSRDTSREQWGNSRDYSGDNSRRRGRDDRTGRYVSRDDMSHDGSYDGSYGNYSRSDETKRMIQKLEGMIENANSDREVKALRQCIDRISR